MRIEEYEKQLSVLRSGKQAAVDAAFHDADLLCHVLADCSMPQTAEQMKDALYAVKSWQYRLEELDRTWKQAQEEREKAAKHEASLREKIETEVANNSPSGYVFGSEGEGAAPKNADVPLTSGYCHFAPPEKEHWHLLAYQKPIAHSSGVFVGFLSNRNSDLEPILNRDIGAAWRMDSHEALAARAALEMASGLYTPTYIWRAMPHIQCETLVK